MHIEYVLKPYTIKHLKFCFGCVSLSAGFLFTNTTCLFVFSFRRVSQPEELVEEGEKEKEEDMGTQHVLLTVVEE